jgi:predicted N-acetyltransferase YhbS
MHCHPDLDESCLEKIGLWEDAGNIVGVVHYESHLGEAFCEIHPGYPSLKPEMLAYAQAQLSGENGDRQRYLRIYVNDCDPDFEALVKARGYAQDDRYARPLSRRPIPDPFRPDIRLPGGFRLKSLADENDLAKIHRVLWRGFNHPGEPPAEGLAWRQKMQSGPHFRKDLTLVVEAPDGAFVTFCGLWYEARNRIAYIEPLATDPDFRRMGLARAALLESLRRCGELGAREAYVASDEAFYQALGFRRVYTSNCWVQQFVADEASI